MRNIIEMPEPKAAPVAEWMALRKRRQNWFSADSMKRQIAVLQRQNYEARVELAAMDEPGLLQSERTDEEQLYMRKL